MIKFYKNEKQLKIHFGKSDSIGYSCKKGYPSKSYNIFTKALGQI